MKITIGLSQKSIDNAIEQLQNEKKRLKQMKIELFEEACKYFLNQANTYIDRRDIGQDLKEELKASWHYSVSEKGVKITNTCEKSAYVEFGVGIVGQSYPHPMADENDYQYNTDTIAKHADGSWVFRSTENQLNVRQKDVTVIGGADGSSELQYHTFGSEGAMFAFDALIDLQHHIRPMWEKIRVKYWG